ncbi:thiamine pyrophosphate-binding protein [Lacisediminimonas sp.]|uniref:thiamine pyrophosphate-binding protein n=1 Tax=Lacisediminimonas sp. TaxID=3060582 RepID=UPI0027177525|nr:thiamine pyrophosphate-binding protein [Lacisediminimonas sp.]MDO8298102.1 thiamine pyrophosphate-binding protein [Lacisediminimonas sp.]
MSEQNIARSGGQVLVDALLSHGVKTTFCVPGESFLSVIDALYEVRDEIKLVVGRQEGGVAHMAEAYGKLTGEPGVCFVTRGPGATNAAIGIHTARQDSTPLIVFVGHIARDTTSREAWQEIDYRHMYGHIAKWVDQIDDARRIPEYISRAFHIATSGRPGPVVLALPEDMQLDMVTVRQTPRYQRVPYHPAPQSISTLQSMLAEAKRPLVMVGGGAWTRAAGEGMARFAENYDLPVICGFRRQDLYDNCDPHYAGEAGLGMDPRVAERIKAADLIIAVGPRIGETSTHGYTLLEVPKPQQRLVHVHLDPDELGHVYHADLPIHAGMEEFARVVAALPKPASTPWHDWTKSARQDYLDNIKHTPMPPENGVDMGEVMQYLRTTLPADSIICNGAGNYTIWVQRFYQYRGVRTQLAPTSGTMGYGVPAAIAAKLVHPERTVVAFAGDGCFLMNGQELATAVQYGINIIVVVVNNGMYGSIRMHQEKQYPERVHASTLNNPDFAALARAYGATGVLVERTEDFAAAFEAARKAGKPALIEVRTDPELITPRATIGALRKAARA